MHYGACPDRMEEPAPPAETPAMAEAAASVERGERQRAMLARLAELGMALAERIVEQTTGEGAAEAGAAFAKVAQAVRRTLALETHLAEGLGGKRADLATQRAERRAKARSDHACDKTAAVIEAVSDAARERHGDTEAAERLIEEAEDLLDLGDEYREYLQRPVGETIVRLCATLALDPEWVIRSGAGWLVKTPPIGSGAWPTPPRPWARLRRPPTATTRWPPAPPGRRRRPGEAFRPRLTLQR